jgi:hypothetical protein
VSTNRDTSPAIPARIGPIRARTALAEILLRARRDGRSFMQSTHASRFAFSTQGGGTFFATQGGGAL